MLEYSFTESFWCSGCGSSLEIARSESDGRDTKMFLVPCPKCAAQHRVQPTVLPFEFKRIVCPNCGVAQSVEFPLPHSR